MAKKKSVKSDVCCAPIGDYKPRLFLQMEGQDVKQIKDLNIGDKVEFIVTGTVKALNQRQRSDYEDPNKTVISGDVDLEGYRVQLMGEEEENEYSKMADEDNNGE